MYHTSSILDVRHDIQRTGMSHRAFTVIFYFHAESDASARHHVTWVAYIIQTSRTGVKFILRRLIDDSCHLGSLSRLSNHWDAYLCGVRLILQHCNCTPFITMTPRSSFVDSPASVEQLLNNLSALTKLRQPLYVDCKFTTFKGKNRISLLILSALPQNHVYIIDVHSLGEATFTVTGTDGQTLRTILESATLPKVFYDVGFKAFMLRHQFGIHLQCVEDIQVMNWASLPALPDFSFLEALRQCIIRDNHIQPSKKREWYGIYHAARNLYSPVNGGSSEVFNERPLNEIISAYCAQCLEYLPRFRYSYWAYIVRLGREQLTIDKTESKLHSNQLGRRLFKNVAHQRQFQAGQVELGKYLKMRSAPNTFPRTSAFQPSQLSKIVSRIKRLPKFVPRV